VALPVEHEECAPSLHHVAAAELPEVEQDGVRLRILAGSAWGVTSRVPTHSSLFCVEATVSAKGELALPEEHPERAAYLLHGDVVVGERRFEAGRLLVFAEGAVRMRAPAGGRMLLLGGRPVGQRFMEWTFVSSRRERIAQARDDWREGRFPTVPGDEEERVPLPG